MKAVYENHYLTDRDVANYARQSFATLADQFSEAQNNKLIQFLARGMQSGDWEKLINEMIHLDKANAHDPFNEAGFKRAKELATYLRSIPEHWVPFGHPHITLRMQAPIPIRVQCFKHKIGFVESEESRRYISTRPEYYIPGQLRGAAANVKQGSAGVHPDSTFLLSDYVHHMRTSIDFYESLLEKGVCAEQARLVLPQGVEVNWVWTGSLYSFANFFKLRTDSHAQKEIQDLAGEVGDIIAPLFPVSWAALTQGVY